MSDRTNDEKLKVLQERLAQIKKKSESADKKEDVVETTTFEEPTSFEEENIIDKSKSSAQTTEPKSANIFWQKNKNIAVIVSFIIGVWMIAYGIFYGYTNINIDSLMSSKSSDVAIEESIPFELKYSFELEESGLLAIIGTFEEEGSAKALVNDLVVKGFKCSYFFLPDNSNSNEESYKVFIGPYENEEETNQWTNNLELDAEIVKL